MQFHQAFLSRNYLIQKVLDSILFIVFFALLEIHAKYFNELLQAPSQAMVYLSILYLLNHHQLRLIVIIYPQIIFGIKLYPLIKLY